MRADWLAGWPQFVRLLVPPTTAAVTRRLLSPLPSLQNGADPYLQLVSSAAYIASVPFTFLAFWLCGW